MRLIDADALKELFSEVIGRIAKKPEMNGNLEHMIRASAMVIQMIDDAPSVQPNTTTHDSIPAETGKNDGDGTSGDCISRTQAIDALRGYLVEKRCPDDGTLTCRLIENEVINKLPSIQPDIIHCKDCEYLCNEDGLRGMCWHINGFGTDIKDKYNSFCSWAERREGG